MSFPKAFMLGFKSGEDLSANENRFVHFDATVPAGDVMKKVLAGLRAWGIQMNTPSATGPIEASVLGGAKLELGGTVSVGDELTSDALGRGVRVALAGEWVNAIALADGVIGDVIPVDKVFFESHTATP